MSGRSVSDESLSPRVQERGSLRTLGNGRSQFIGSSSGVYFVNTVRRAFAEADVRISSILPDVPRPAPEDCIVADDDEVCQPGQRVDEASAAPSRAQSPPPGVPSYGSGIPAALGRPPPCDVARSLLMAYFQTWHRFFPFLHGPTIGKDIESMYLTTDQDLLSTTGRHRQSEQSLPLARVIIIQCLFNLASIHGGVELPVASRIDRPARVLPCLLGLAAKADVTSIQALFSMQLLLVARMSIRTATVVGGLLSRAIFLAGLHRCPARYRELSADDCDMRKRLFWCIYVLDRFLSQTLGHPLGIQDSDVDVCSLAGPELHHSHIAPRELSYRGIGASSFYSNGNDDAASTSENNERVEESPPEEIRQRNDRNMILSSQVEYSRLSGRALELFHKSIHIRSIDPSTVLALRTDLNAWWNALPTELQELGIAEEESGNMAGLGQPFRASAFFTLLNNQLRLLINRPWLSLEPSTPEFQSALQICIGISRDIILTTRKQHNEDCALFWPGYLSAAWMAGIILAFACHLQLYPAEKGQREISLCLDVLASMRNRWPLARNCHIVLTDLQQTAQQNRYQSPSSPSPGMKPGIPTKRQFPNGNGLSEQGRPSKRRQTDIDAQTGGPSAYSLDKQKTSNTCSEGITQQVELPFTLGPNDPSLSGPTLNPSVEANPSHDLQSETLPSSQHTQQQQIPSMPQDVSPHITPNFRSAGTMGFPSPGFGGLDGESIGLTDLSNWDGGMPDILGGATWESLLQVVDPDKFGWDDQFL